MHGIEIRRAFRTEPPEDIDRDLPNSTFDPNSPHTLEFSESDRGKRIYMAGRWEIEREGEKGKYGDITTAIVP
ncbi:MAG: hypothetical protein LBC62_09300 [Treponema sp.]|nr:hypothetical protein [Treponema sp.]